MRRGKVHASPPASVEACAESIWGLATFEEHLHAVLHDVIHVKVAVAVGIQHLPNQTHLLRGPLFQFLTLLPQNLSTENMDAL